MSKQDFLAIFGDFLSAETKGKLNDIDVNKCLLNVENRSLEIELSSGEYISDAILEEIKTSLIIGLKLRTLNISVKFSGTAFTNEAAADITRAIRNSKPALNGFFNGALFDIKDNTVEITLKYGGLKVITENGFNEAFIKRAKQLFGIDVTLSFLGQTEDVEIKYEEIPLPEEPDDDDETANAYTPKYEPVKMRKSRDFTFEDRDDVPENGKVYLDNPKLFFGNALDVNTRDMISIQNFEQEISCWGQVFGFESREITTRKGPRVSINFYISDSTNSLPVTFFLNPEAAGKLSLIKDGEYLLVNGKYEYDNYKKCYVIKPTSLALVQHYEEKDLHSGEKRIELHCHTNMSAKDGMSSAADIIKRAYSWGHKAIAITDHGVLQAYPGAAKAVSNIRKKGGKFKVIYGVEAYYIDDSVYDLSKLTPKQIARIRNHQIILVKNLVGLKNLYKLVSFSHLQDFHARPIILKSKLQQYREGLIVGSACEQGEVYRAIVDGKPSEEIEKIAEFYDYLEIQPMGNNAFMVRDSVLPDKIDKKGEVTPNRFKHVTSFDVIRDFNLKVVSIADKIGKPVVATGDVHFLRKEDAIIRKIIMAGQGYDDFDEQPPLYLKTTDEMLGDFEYFGDRAKEFVIDNPNKIADMIDDTVIPIPEGSYPPVIEGSDDLLIKICHDNVHKIYGKNPPKIVTDRLEKELNSIISHGFSIMYISAQKVVSFSEEHGYLVGSRGSVGSSFVATMAGISEVNPLAPHYVCPKCCHSEFFTDGSVGSGFDLPEKECPECHTLMRRDGHDIPFETFLGFEGDKTPDIDLNFSDEFQNEVQKYTETLFGRENVFKAGTITTIAEKTAYGFAKAYAEKKQIVLSNAELNRLALAVKKAKVKTTTGQHPAGMIIVPKDKTIYDFCPVQHPADDVTSSIITTHFDFNSIHDTILKLDELGHVIPTTYKYLEEYSGIPVSEVSMSDPDVYSLFISTKALGVTPEEIKTTVGTFCIPEFGTKFVRDMLTDCKPKNFADLLQISGLSHGTDVYLGNAKDLIDNGTCTISEVIGTRDNIMVYLISMGMTEKRAFDITETVRKGRVAKGEISREDWAAMEEDMRKVGVPEWYIRSCYKIKYMFPKAHAAAYVISALRVGWYKVHRPLEFYCAYFTARPEDVDVKIILSGKEEVRNYLTEIEQKGKEASQKELDVYDNMLIFNEILSRGIEILPIDIKKSHAVKYVPENGKMRLPFVALSGIGESAAWSLYKAAQSGDFVSVEDFQNESGVSKAVIASLDEINAFGDIPQFNQMSMF